MNITSILTIVEGPLNSTMEYFNDTQLKPYFTVSIALQVSILMVFITFLVISIVKSIKNIENKRIICSTSRRHGKSKKK